jgi:hypothetical protein
MEGNSLKDITISSSSRSYGEVRNVRDKLEALGLSVYTPDLDFDETKVKIDSEEKHLLTFRFLEKIKNSKSLLVVTNDAGYVGNSVCLEVGYAYGMLKPIFCLRPISEPAIACLSRQVNNLRDLLSILKGV